MTDHFPTRVFPDNYRHLIERSAQAIGCDESMVGLPALTVMAAAIGNSRQVLLKADWVQSPVLWGGVVGRPGSAKSPTIKEAVRPLQDQQQHDWREQTKTRYLTSDSTLASLAPILAANPRGLLLSRDELTGWVDDVNKRSGSAQWLSFS